MIIKLKLILNIKMDIMRRLQVYNRYVTVIKNIKNNNKRNTSYDKIDLNKKQYHKRGIPYEQYNTRIKV